MGHSNYVYLFVINRSKILEFCFPWAPGLCVFVLSDILK